jgi:hypothetical protein
MFGRTNTGHDGDNWIPMMELCFTDKTLYGIDEVGRVWFIDMRTGDWALHGNPTESQITKDGYK